MGKTTYTLEMSSRDELRPARNPSVALEFTCVEIPCPEFNWFLHQMVGTDFRWGGRDDWRCREWTDYVSRPELETWVAYVKGTPAGYCELEKQTDGSVRIVCFGLSKQFLGRQLGGVLLTRAVQRCWDMGAQRVWLRTCSHDHPHALRNYLACGFQIVDVTHGPENPPRGSVLFACPRMPSEPG